MERSQVDQFGLEDHWLLAKSGPVLTEGDIRVGIEDLGLAGKALCVHSSLYSFGMFLDHGPETVVNGVLSAGCSMMVPTFRSRFDVPPPNDPAKRPTRNGWDYEHEKAFFWPEDSFSHPEGPVFRPSMNVVDVKTMGQVPWTLLRVPGRVRGKHPTASFTAAGRQARQLIRGQAPLNVYRPLENLVRHGGWVLMMGTGFRTFTLIHLAEKRAGRNLFRRWAKDRRGNIMMVEVGGCSQGFERLEPALDHLERRTLVGESLWRAFPAREALDAATAAIVDDPEITRCADDTCSRCRDAVLGGPVL
jgi:aminoglycoside N3'-acetyltransferase